MNIGIAGIGLTVEGIEDDFLPVIEPRYAAFALDSRQKLVIRAEAMGSLTSGSTAPCTKEPFVLVETTDDRGQKVRLERFDNPFRASLDLETGEGELVFERNPYCFDSFLRILYSVLLVRAGGVLLHAAGVVVDSEAALLVGSSGAGKTTVSGLGFSQVLSDELVAVRRGDDGFVVYATPFWGEWAIAPAAGSADLARVYLLRQGDTHSVVLVGAGEAALEILGSAFFFGPPDDAGRVLDFCAELAESRLAGELWFAPDPGVVDLLEETHARV